MSKMPESSKKDPSSDKKSLDRESRTKARADQLFKILIVVFLVVLAWMITQVKSCTDEMKIIWKDQCEIAFKATGFQWADVTEFWVTVVAAVACYLLREISAYFIYPYFFNLLNFEEKEKTRAVKADKLTDKTFSMIYHILIIIYGYIVLSKTEYLPRMLGGSGSNEFTKFYSEFPCITSGYEESLRTYYLVTLGYRVYKTYILIYQWCRNEHRSDFIEMFLHHIGE